MGGASCPDRGWKPLPRALLFAVVCLLQTAYAAEVRTVDRETLAGYDDVELRELLDHAGTCGRIVLIGVSPAVVEVFLNRAGCGGHYLALAPSADKAAAAVKRIAARPAPARATKAQLRTLLEAQSDDGRISYRIVAFLAGFLALFSILLISKSTRLIALGFSVAATLLAYVIWPPAVTGSFVAWAETDLHWQVARFDGLERRRSYRDGTFAIDDEFSRGSFPLKPVISHFSSPGGVTICNKGKVPLTALYVSWRNALYEIEELRPGAHWTNEGALPVVSDRPEVSLFVERSTGADLAILRQMPRDNAYLLQRGLLDHGVMSCER